jgi:predicted DNA-binding transcriptional regulator YafY
MPKIKNAHLRYRVIDRTLTNPAKPYPTGEDLRRACAEEVMGISDFNLISVSTLEKDLQAMRAEFDAPIRFSKSYGGYYYSDPDFSLQGVPLSAEEMESIRTAINTLGQFRTVPIFQHFGSAIDKLTTRMTLEQVSPSASEEVVQFEQAPSTAGTEHIAPILQAIYNRQSIEFTHQKFTDDEVVFRRVDPYLLKEYRNRWYLIGYSHLAQDIRTFGLDRISSVTITDKGFVRRPDFDPDLYFRYSVGITTSGGKPERITFTATRTLTRYLQSQPIHESQQEIGTQGDLTVFSLHTLITSELLITLLGYGKSLRVLSPESLVEKMRHETREMLALYESNNKTSAHLKH